MLTAAGAMDLAFNYFPDTLSPELKRNRDFGWINSPILRSDVQILLDTIKNNFRPHPVCWVNAPVNANYNLQNYAGGYLQFPYDSICLNVNTVTNYPDQDHRLLMLFKYWNIVRYFNPYSYVLDKSWDSTLFNRAVPISTTADAYSFFLLYLKMATDLDDAHVYGLTYSDYYWMPGFYRPLIRLKYTGGQYVVTKSQEAGIYPGDAIITIDGLTPTQWEDSLRQYFSSGNLSVFHRSMSENILLREQNNYIESIVVEDSNGVQQLHSCVAANPVTNINFFNDPLYYADSLSTIAWTTMPCDIGYVNLANLQPADVASMYDDLQSKSAIIIDLRYSQTTINTIGDKLYPNKTLFGKFQLPNTSYPGTYYWDYQYIGINGNPTPYQGSVLVLMDENTQSNLEYSCLVLDQLPNVAKVGSQTAGADGNVTFFSPTTDLHFGFTTLGIFYPNGDSTQRIGIVPDWIVYNTRAGIGHHRDEVLEKALQVAGCNLIVKNDETAFAYRVFPVPSSNNVNIELNGVTPGDVEIVFEDINGRKVLSKYVRLETSQAKIQIDITPLVAGVYTIKIVSSKQTMISKFVKS